jgi:hypothetical protein
MAMATQHATRRKLSGPDRTAPAYAAEFRLDFEASTEHYPRIANSLSQSRPEEEIA